MTREQHYKAALKGGVAFAQLKCTDYDDVAMEPDRVAFIHSLVSNFSLNFGVEIDSNLLHFATTIQNRATAIFKQLAFQKVTSATPGMVSLFMYTIERGSQQ